MSDETHSDPDGRRGAGNGQPIVVGVGASPGSLDSIEAFLSALTLPPDIAVVLVLQHREALDEDRLQAALRGRKLKAVRPGDGEPVEGGKLYLCDPGFITALQDGHFTVREADEEPGERGTIDSFLVSLAEERAEEAIGIVLAGTGSEGTLGVSTLKDQGGLAIAQREPSSEANPHVEGY